MRFADGFAAFTCFPAPAAEGDGRGDLDKATEAKLAASSSGSISDLNEAIRLAESAMEKGLDATSTEFAKRLLGSAFLQRGQEETKQLFSNASSADDFRKRRQTAVSDLEVEYSEELGKLYYFKYMLAPDTTN